MSDEDFRDTAVVGGVALSDVLSGKVHEWEIPAAVKHAFNLQYPHLHEGFASAVQRLSEQPERLQGLVNGVRGKLFEVDYVSYLNQGHLPYGMTAELAKSATNKAWDIRILDQHGHVNHLLQLKASAGLEAAKRALALHPNVDVVVPHDVLAHFSEHANSMGHLLDGHETLTHLDHTMNAGVHHAELATGAFHVPYVTFAWIVLTTFQRYRTGDLSLNDALRNMTQRAVTSGVAVAAGWMAQALLHKTIVGIPVAMWVNVKMRKWFKQNESRKIIDQQITIVGDARSSLASRTRRMTLVLGPPAPQS